MNEDFLDWLDNCPVQWFLEELSEKGRRYFFVDEGDDKNDN